MDRFPRTLWPWFSDLRSRFATSNQVRLGQTWLVEFDSTLHLRLENRSFFAQNKLVARKRVRAYSHYHLLRQKWLARHKLAKRKFHKKHKEALDWIIENFPAKEQLAGSAVGMLMLSNLIPTSTVLGSLSQDPVETETVSALDRTNQLLDELNQVVPDKMRTLNGEEEAKISAILSKYFGANVSAAVNGLRLNRSYGVIGAEQHLVRFPTDNMATHLDAVDRNNKMIYSSGMAPGRGAWGYFAKSKAEFTEADRQREKWYIAVQTFAAPNYNARLADYRDFFKWRKMLVLNPKTGQAVVADIADAGPAIWTGKHLGGSPEIMYSLGFGQGSRKGGVLYFFIDDIDDKIALGPVKPTSNLNAQ